MRQDELAIQDDLIRQGRRIAVRRVKNDRIDFGIGIGQGDQIAQQDPFPQDGGVPAFNAMKGHQALIAWIRQNVLIAQFDRRTTQSGNGQGIVFDGHMLGPADRVVSRSDGRIQQLALVILDLIGSKTSQGFRSMDIRSVVCDPAAV